MGKGEEVEHPVLIGDGHAALVGSQGGDVLSVGEHHALAVARGAAGIEDIGQVGLVGLLVECLHLRLPWQVFAQFQEVIEIEGVRVVGTDAHLAVEDDDSLQRGAEGGHPVGLVILVLFAYEEEPHLGVVHHEFYLLFAAGGIEGDGDGPDAPCAEVDKQVGGGVL